MAEASSSGAAGAAAATHLQDSRSAGTLREYVGGRNAAQQGLGQRTAWGTALLPAPGAMVRGTTDRVHVPETSLLS